MNIQNLSAFIAVSETGSFSKAATRLFITQPAVSKRISALESELDVKLFDRIGKSVQLTEAGSALVPSCLRILAELEESRRIVNNLSGHIGGQLKIGTSHHIGLHRLPPVLSHYTRLYEQVDLDIHFMDSEEACAAVLKGELEIAIATLPDKAPAKLATHIIWHDPLGVVVSRKHPLAKQKNITLKNLVEHPAILPSQSTYTRALLEKMLGIRTDKLKIDRLSASSNFEKQTTMGANRILDRGNFNEGMMAPPSLPLMTNQRKTLTYEHDPQDTATTKSKSIQGITTVKRKPLSSVGLVGANFTSKVGKDSGNKGAKKISKPLLKISEASDDKNTNPRYPANDGNSVRGKTTRYYCQCNAMRS